MKKTENTPNSTYAIDYEAERQALLEEFLEDEITAVESPYAMQRERRNPKRSGDYLKADIEAVQEQIRKRALCSRVR